MILMDEFSSKMACVTPQNWNFEKKMDEFSSKTVCVTTRKMKTIWMSFPWFANKG